MANWLVVAVSGVTNGGKSRLTRQLKEVLPDSTKFIAQDDYFYPEDSSNHIPCPGGLNHHNWEAITSMDMKKMKDDIRTILDSNPNDNNNFSLATGDTVSLDASDGASSQRPYCNILLLDGFLMFEDAELTNMCDLRYFLTLTKEQCWQRRSKREYDPPDPPSYFEVCVWPMYESHLAYVKGNVSDVVFLDGMENHFENVHRFIVDAAKLKFKI